MKDIVLPSFISFKMGGRIVEHGEGVELVLGAVDFGGTSEFTKPRNMLIDFVFYGNLYCY